MMRGYHCHQMRLGFSNNFFGKKQSLYIALQWSNFYPIFFPSFFTSQQKAMFGCCCLLSSFLGFWFTVVGGLLLLLLLWPPSCSWLLDLNPIHFR